MNGQTSGLTLNDLREFLNFVERGRSSEISRLAFAGDALSAFKDYLVRKQIEYSEIGIHQLHDNKLPPVQLSDAEPPDIRATVFSANAPDGAPRLEGGLREFIPARPMEWRLISDGVAEWIERLLPETASSIRSAGDSDAQVVVGRAALAPVPDDDGFYGFYFGGKAPETKRTEDMLAELEVATSALKNKIEPAIRVSIDNADPSLTAREAEILHHAAKGAQRADMADAMGVSVATVDLHLANMRKRLGGRTLAEAVAKGHAYGLI